MEQLPSNQASMIKRCGKTTRLSITIIAGMLCLLFCGGFWLTEREPHAPVLGWYSLRWFVVAVGATGAAVLFTCMLIRRLWLPTNANVSADADNQYRISTRKRAAFVVVIMLVPLGSLELSLRYLLHAAQVRTNTTKEQPVSYYHAHLQITRRDEVDGKLVRTFRGRVPQRCKSTEFRIVCLGGSTTWGHGAAADKAWPAVLERILCEDGCDVEVINAGFPWYSTASSLVNYALLMRHYNPDVVIITHGVNDLYRSFPQPGEPPFELDYGSYGGPMRKLLRARNQPENTGSWNPIKLVTSSAIYRFLNAATGIERRYYSALRWRWAVPEREVLSSSRAAARKDASTEVDLGLDAFPSLESFRRHIEYLVQLCKQDGCQVVLGTQAHIYSRLPVGSGPTPKHYLRNLLFRLPDDSVVSRQSVGAAMAAIRDSVFEIARCEAVSLADVEIAVDANPDLFVDDFHLTIEGNVIAARVFAQVLRPLLVGKEGR
ncbi:MAG: hypothetical protein KAV82_12805 [Phycisphaerae bacterium]|nr:hypothetical protein [Phycisphaerae bacterium]